MASYPRRETFPLLIFFAVVLISLTLMPTRELAAQCVVGAFCTTNADCGIDANFCNGTESCTGTCGSDVTFSCCVCGASPPTLTPCGDDALFCNGINVCDDTESCVAEDTLFQNPACGANGECGDFCDETNDICADPAGTPCTDDGNPCTTDACNGIGPIGACVSTNNTAPCIDGVNCTINDVCAGGACNGTAVQCNDSITCTLDTCVEATGQCQFDNAQCECQTDADCDDQNPCTDEFCNPNFTCIRNNNTDPCDDLLFCNGPDTCGGGTCSVHGGDPCTGGGQCAQICDENGDNCFAPTGLACDDGDLITITECDGKGACLTVANIATQGSTVFGCSLRSSGEDGIRTNSLFFALVGVSGLLFFLGRFRHRDQGRSN